MNDYIYGTYQKHIKYSKNGCVFSLLLYGEKRSRLFVGNVPKIDNLSGVKKVNKRKKEQLQGISLPFGIMIKNPNDLQTHSHSEPIEVTDYIIPYKDKEINRLKTLGYEPEDFFDNVKFQKITKFLWRDLEKSREPYKYYSFEKADSCYKAIGGYYESSVRLEALNKEVITYFRDNNKYYYSLEEYVDAFRKAERKGSFSQVSNNAIFSFFVKSKSYFYDGKNVWDKEIKDANSYIKNRFTRYGFSKSSFVKPEIIESYIEKHPEISVEQKECIYDMATDNILIITGGAGTGKTTIIKALLDVYNECFETGSLLLAPTGKASRRIAEKCDCDSFTIHHALRKSIDDDFIFYKENNPFPERLFIVDEGSMLDTLLMRDILKAISVGSKVVFVGDYQQLEAVGCGSPFHEMIESGLCKVIKLTKNFRQNGDNCIYENGNEVLNGGVFFEGEGVTINEISLEDLGKYVSEDTINISPYRKICSAINKTFFDKYKNKDKFQDGYYYKGCKVVFLKNTKKYSNGDTGHIISFDNKTMLVELDDSAGNIIEVNRDDLDNMQFGYALTTHKVQGSEYDSVKLFLPKKLTSFSANPNMLYTMITRAKSNVEIYYYEEREINASTN